MSDPFRPLGAAAPQVVRLDVSVDAQGRVSLNFGRPMPPQFSLPPNLARGLGRLLLEAADKAEGRIILPPTVLQS